ncbi:MAG TPA: acyltransferase family protein [Pseudomonas sp.]|uniref:acyltransferase family protein n=1 Tax=Pseudomonas sp. TaxID=306 RepID=UPI002C1CAF77|nr:acyltransferase family protein [Pseudomonas sp.]HSX90780.1 acyltransferase family protein [Pseudomonas sp.]
MTPSESEAIKICRVLCIFFMSYVHVNPGLDSFAGELPAHLALLESVFSDVLGRASVPALSVLGGFLAVTAYARRRNWAVYARERWQTLMIPLISWNAVIILLSVLIWLTSGAQTAVLRELPSLQWVELPLLLDRLTAYNYGSATTALNFLRDIFVCSLLLPALLMLLRYTGAAGLALLWLVGLTLGFAPVVMRPAILMFFGAGIYLGLQGSLFRPSLGTLSKLSVALLLPLALVGLAPLFAGEYRDNAADTLSRLLVSGAFLLAAYGLSRVSVDNLLVRLEPMIYLMFLAHASIMLVFWGIWQKAMGSGLEWPYGLFYISAPLATLLAVAMLYRCLAYAPAILQHALTGKPCTDLARP